MATTKISTPKIGKTITRCGRKHEEEICGAVGRLKYSGLAIIKLVMQVEATLKDGTVLVLS